MSELRKSLVIGGERYNLAVGQAGEGPPGENTQGKVGVTYLDTSAAVPVLYVCTAAVKSGEQIKCTWVQVGGAGSGSGENPSGGGLSTTAVNLLIEILENAIYNTNMTGKIESLKVELGYIGGGDTDGDTPDDPDEPVVTDDITVSDGVMTILTVGSEITVSGGVMTIA